MRGESGNREFETSADSFYRPHVGRGASKSSSHALVHLFYTLSNVAKILALSYGAGAYGRGRLRVGFFIFNIFGFLVLNYGQNIFEFGKMLDNKSNTIHFLTG